MCARACVWVQHVCVYACVCAACMCVCVTVCVFMEREMESFEQCIIAFSFNIVGLMFKENTEYP